ncbi:MAG TPA: MBL fold metallo-hydrolase [Actinocrinis sp.]|uniref:MBL fold metallo-hydrolase n=1 Tax=Actinocrinis sp. TaxID=1920516 RepID=UPI002D39A01F|nr:MBL fold metallo-hydrolase [Actinocrinis sp.]HZU55563.1 MBL fold metallo-hydrolase [Actinocrinis sp.]
MSYHGNVTVGGPAEVRELAPLMITKVAVGPYDNNAYLLRCRQTDEQMLIDAAAEPDRLLQTIGSSLAAVVTTHQHGDHWQALQAVVDATGARTAAGEYDADGIPVHTDLRLRDGETINVGNIPLRVIHLVGHTPGSIALLYDDPKGHPHLFTGDCLFPGGIGNTQKDPERFASLYRDVVEKIFNVLPDETWVYPGHGRDTTLGAERPHLEEWRQRGW